MTEPDEIRPEQSALNSRPAFESIVCGIDGSSTSREAARQAALLAEPGSEVSFVAVVPAPDSERSAEAVPQAEQALQEAADFAGRRGVKASCHVLQGDNPTRLLLDASGPADLLVVGSLERSRTGGILLGSTASAAVHAAPTPVLAARSAPEEHEFPSDILVGTDGSPDARRGVELTAAIARAHGSRVALVHVRHGHSESHRGLAEDAVLVMEAIGVEPVTIEDTGDPHERIAELARRERASLLVIGSRGLGGVRALGSVSERVAHEAPCSVLIARPRT